MITHMDTCRRPRACGLRGSLENSPPKNVAYLHPIRTRLNTGHRGYRTREWADSVADSVVPDGLHEPHRPVLVALEYHKGDEDVPHPARDRVAPVQHPARVAAHLKWIRGALEREV